MFRSRRRCDAREVGEFQLGHELATAHQDRGQVGARLSRSPMAAFALSFPLSIRLFLSVFLLALPLARRTGVERAPNGGKDARRPYTGILPLRTGRFFSLFPESSLTRFSITPALFIHKHACTYTPRDFVWQYFVGARSFSLFGRFSRQAPPPAAVQPPSRTDVEPRSFHVFFLNKKPTPLTPFSFLVSF